MRLARRSTLVRLAWLGLMLAAGGAGLWACSRGVLERDIPVIIISIDTCRADHLGCYGRSPSPSPALDALASEGVLFDETVTPVPLTLPAHCSLLTGLTPLQHGVHDNMTYRLGDGQLTLAEMLRDRGYATGAVLGAFVLDDRFGLSQGFDAYDDAIGEPEDDSVLLENERLATEVTDRACAWIDAQAGRAFFLFVHYYDPHSPYAPPEPYAGRFAGQPYAAEIAYADAEIGRLLRHLRDRGLYDRALIVAAGDHGESLGEHGETMHGHFVYQSTLRVPLIVKPPRAKAGAPGGQRVGARAGLIDVVPTVLGYLGLPCAAGVEGRDLSRPAAPAAEAESRDFYCESLTPTTYGCSPLLGLVREDWKLIDSSNPELYALADDPQELRNRAGELPARVEEMRATLVGLVAGRAEDEPGSDRASADEETRQRLQSLGYIAGRAVEDDLRLDDTRPAPRDLIGYHEAMQKVLDRMGRRDLNGARELGERMLREHPEIPDALILLGDIACQQGDLAQAVTHYQAYLIRDEARTEAETQGGEEAAGHIHLSNRYRAHYDLANVLASLGRLPEAEEHYRQTLRLVPTHVDAAVNLALLLAEAGRLDEAIPLFRDALAIEPDSPDIRMDLAQALALQGGLDEALQQYEAVIAAQPERSDALLARGDLLVQMGCGAEAVESYAQAVRHGPEDPQGHIRLARALLAQGRTEEALAAYRRGLSESPAWPEVARELVWVLATHENASFRNGAEALRVCTRLLGAVGDSDPAVLELMAACQAEQGHLGTAVQCQEKALTLARTSGSQGARGLEIMESRLRLYRSGRPLRHHFVPGPGPS